MYVCLLITGSVKNIARVKPLDSAFYAKGCCEISLVELVCERGTFLNGDCMQCGQKNLFVVLASQMTVYSIKKKR